jgi:hypothetical protein
MKLSQQALLALQQMMGEEGAVFLRNLPINFWPLNNVANVPWDKSVDIRVFQELKDSGCIKIHHGSYNLEQWRMTDLGEKVLRESGMATRPGTLSRGDLDWLFGTGQFAQ